MLWMRSAGETCLFQFHLLFLGTHPPMNRLRLIYFCTHVLLPLIAGTVFYLFDVINGRELPGSAYLPDGLWAYAFCSCLLIVWNRHINILWLSVATLAALLFEILQYIQWIDGTGDPVDVLVYCISGGAALLLNRFLNNRYLHRTNSHTTNKTIL